MTEIQAEATPAERLLPLPPLHALRAFHAAARFGRFRDAASALGLSESAISHQVRKLEDHLGVQLFERDGNRVRLSAVGETYFNQIDPAFARIRKATDELAGPCCRVSLTLPRSLATMWLIPRLAQLESAVPGVNLQMITTGRICDLRREQIDLGIRYGSGHWPALTIHHLFDEEAFPVCRPGYVSQATATDGAGTLATCRFIIQVPGEWQEWAAARGLTLEETTQTIAVQSSYDSLEAASQGLGLAIGRRPLVDRYLEDGRLVAPFGTAEKSGCAYYLVYPEDAELNVPSRQVARWILTMAKDRETAAVI
jgi:LysR family glycine cleavage system transcriptional activator